MCLYICICICTFITTAEWKNKYETQSHSHIQMKATLISVTLSIQRSGKARVAAEKYLHRKKKQVIIGSPELLIFLEVVQKHN